MFWSCKGLKQKAKDEEIYAIDFGAVNVVANPVYKGSAEKLFQLKHTKLELKPNWQQHTLSGIADITLFAYAYPQDSLILDAKSFDIQEVSLTNKNQPAKTLNYSYDKQKIHIKLGKTYQPGQEINIHIKYIARPEEQFQQGIIKRKSDQGLYFIDPENKDPYLPRQLWSQGEVKNNCAWFPTIDEPNQKFTQEIALTVDSSLETLSNGSLVYSNFNKDGTRTDFWQQTQPHSAYLAMIAVGDWYVEHDNWRDSIPVEYYLEKQYAPYAKLIFGHTPQMIEFYSKVLGVDYPWDKYSQVVVREFVSGAMENTTATVHYEPVQHDAREHLDDTYESIIAHELFHHWFGDYVTAEGWSDLSLNESFATYGERLWEEYKYGADEAAYGRQQDLEAYLAETIYSKEAIINHYYNDAEDLFDRHRYEKGGLVLHMLRTVLGDSVFFHGLHIYLTENAHKNAEISQLRIAMEEASGQDLNWFFDEWFLKPGHPSLVIKQKYNTLTKKLTLYVEQIQKDKKDIYFKMPVQLHIYLPGKMLQENIWIAKNKDSFSFSLAQEPLLVNFDAEKYLLAQKVEIKPVAQWYHQYMQAKNYMDRYEAINAISNHTALLSEDSLLTLLNKTLTDTFWNIRRRSIDALLPNTSKEIQSKFVTQIRNIAATDKNAKVRFSAYLYMQNKKAFPADDIYMAALKDSSYKIVASAINGLRMHTPKEQSGKLLAKIAPFEKYHNSDVLFALAQVYAQYPDSLKLDFFHSIPRYIPSNEYGRFADAYKQYMEKMPATIVLREKYFILSLAPKINDIWAKISYKSMLLSFAEQLRRSASLGQAGKKASDEFLNAAQQVSLNAEQ